MTLDLRTEITLAAPPDAVWAILTDFGRYPEWNPFVRHIEGPLVLGGTLAIRFAPTLSWSFGFTAKVVMLESRQGFAWLGGPKWLLNGRHYFELAPDADGQATRLRHGEVYTGLLSRVFGCLLGRDPTCGYRAMNEALNERLRYG